MFTKSLINNLSIIVIFGWMKSGSSGPSGPSNLGDIVHGLGVTSRNGSDGKLHHIVSSAYDIAYKLGLRTGQELLLIQPSSTSVGIPCVGRNPADIMREITKIKECEEFTIVVKEGNSFKTMTGFVGWYRQQGEPGPRPGGQPGPKPEERPIVRVTVAWSSLGFMNSPQKKETVFIQPYNYPGYYLKNEGGNIGSAALQNQPDWKFYKLIYFNFTALLEGRLEAHAVFKLYGEPMFIHTNGQAVSLLSAAVSANDAPANLIQTETFIQHFVDASSQLNHYEPSNHKGKYIAFNTTTKSLYLTSSQDHNTMFYTKQVPSITNYPTYSRGPKRPNGYPRGEQGTPRGHRDPGLQGPRGAPGPSEPGPSWSYNDECVTSGGHNIQQWGAAGMD